MSALVLSVRDPLPALPGDPPLPATLTVAAQSGGAEAMTGTFKGRIRPPARSTRQWPHHLAITVGATEPRSFTR